MEPEITINGQKLTNAQAMAVRVVLSSYDPFCGDDEHGVAMSDAYAARLKEVLRMMLGSERS